MRSLRIVFVAILVMRAAAPVSAQFPPAEVKNLKVLPKDMAVREVIATMRGFAIGLGVRCEYCHVGEPGANLATFDFASDEKPTKEKARIMLAMVSAINQDHLAKLPADGTNTTNTHLVVGCETCHRGQSKPYTLEQKIRLVFDAAGGDSAVAAFKSLREEFYGSGTYDFSELRLAGLALEFVQGGKAEDALKLMRANLEFHPQSSGTVMIMGDAFAALENKDEAIKHYRWALELDPRNRAATQRLQRITGGN